MKIIPSIVTLLFLIAAGTVSSPAQNATTVEPLLVYKALQDKDCRHWVDSVMDKLSFKEKVGRSPVNMIFSFPIFITLLYNGDKDKDKN